MKSMSKYFAMLVFLIASCSQQQEDTPTRGHLNVLSSESQWTVMRNAVDTFTGAYQDTKISILPTSTRDAIVQLINDSVKLICVDRELNTEEKAAVEKKQMKIQQIKVAEDALGIVVHKDNGLDSITQKMLGSILRGDVRDWNAAKSAKLSGNIELAITGRNSGTYELLTRKFFKMDTDAAVTFVADSQGAVVQYVKTHPRAIGVVSVSALRDTTLPVKVLFVEAIDSAGQSSMVRLHQANIYRETYPLHYPVYIYINTGETSVAMGFSTFIADRTGQQIFMNAGLAPRTVPVRLVQLHQE